ncbi:MAG: HEPN domain-containing protein [Bacteroidales bacterium]|nr:HEPN domain-containing protein [Bacteroidales bacterium]
MSLTSEERFAVVKFRIDKALRAYREAKGVLNLGYWETIANRLYYAAYNAVSALLIANGDIAQTHSGVIHIFGLHFITTGKFSSEDGRLYHKLFTMRQTGDYDDTYGLMEDDVRPFVEPTGEFIERVIQMANTLLDDNAD